MRDLLFVLFLPIIFVALCIVWPPIWLIRADLREVMTNPAHDAICFCGTEIMGIRSDWPTWWTLVKRGRV